MNTTNDTPRHTAGHTTEPAETVQLTTPIRELLSGLNYAKEVQHLIKIDVEREQKGIVPANSNICELVGNERISSRYWKYVEAVAKRVNPEKYSARMAFLQKARSAYGNQAA
jgi:hypothetical protein